MNWSLLLSRSQYYINNKTLTHCTILSSIFFFIYSNNQSFIYLFTRQKSQFFIIYEQQPHLDNMHTVFGQVLDGWDTLDKWERLPVWGEKAPSRSQKTTPLEPPEIVAITIHANPLADNGITYPTPDGPPEKK